jgi:hypothetical protein
LLQFAADSLPLFLFPARQILASIFGMNALLYATGSDADTLECGSWLPLFRRQIRTPVKHPQPRLIVRKAAPLR